MKKFTKILAAVLALITVLAMLPVSVIADAWLDVDVKPLPDDSGSKVTVTLDSKELLQILKEEGVSKDLLERLLKDATVDTKALLQVFTLEEIFKIIPREKILDVLNLKELVSEIGVDELSKYIDIPALLAKCNKTEIAALLRDIPDLYNYANIEELISGGYIPDHIILDNLKDAELEAAVSTIDPDDIIPEILALPTFADIERLIRVYDLVLTDKVIVATDVLNTTEANKRAEALFKDPTFNVNNYVSYVYEDAAKAYFKAQYAGMNMNDSATLEKMRELIEKGYFEVSFDYTVNSINLLTLIDEGYLKIDELKALVEDYIVSVFEAKTEDELEALANKGCFDYEIDILSGIVAVTNVDLYAVLEECASEFNAETLRANCPALDLYIDKKVDEWSSDDDVVKDLMDTNCVDITVDRYEITKVDYQKLIADDFVSANELIANDLVNIADLAVRLVDDGLLTVDEKLVDTDKLLVEVKKIPASTLYSYFNTEVAVEYFGSSKIIEWLGGYEKAMKCIDLPGVTEDILNILPSILDAITASGKSVNDVFYFDKLLPQLDFQKIIKMVGVDNIMAQLDNDEIRELLTKIDIKGKLQTLLVLFYDHAMKNIDKIALNGHVLAEEDDTSLLRFNAGEMVRLAKDLVPTLNDLATLDSNTLLSLDFEMVYTPDGTNKSVTKRVVFDFVLNGGVEKIKAAAQALQNFLSKYINEFTIRADRIALDINMPNKIGAAYAKLLNSPRIPESIRLKIANVTNLEGNDLVTFINEKLTFEEIMTLLESIEPSAVFEAAKNSEFVKLCFAKVGKTVPNVTLDELWAAINNAEYTLENICAAIEKVTHRDVMAVLQNAAIKFDAYADKAEQVSAIEKMIDLVESKLNVNLSGLSAQEILERAADVDIYERLSAVVAARIGVNVRNVFQNNTPDELWDLAVEKAYSVRNAYNKVRNYILAGLDKLPDVLMSTSIADLYDGNGVFAVDKTFTYNAKAILEKAIAKILTRVSNDKVEEALELIMSRVTDSDITTTVYFAIRFHNMFEITYMDRDGKQELFTALMPVGADLNIYKNNSTLTGYEFTGWADENGNPVNTMPARDITVYADLHSVELTFTNKAGDVLGTIYMPKGGSLSLAKYASIFAQINAIAQKGAPELSGEDRFTIDSYNVIWTYGENGVIDLANKIGLNATFTEDTVLVCDYEENHHISFRDPSVDYRIDYADGVYTVTILGAFKNEYALDIKSIVAHANAESFVKLVIAIEDGNFVLAAVENKTLKNLHAATATAPYVWFEYLKNDTVTESFKGTLYENLQAPAYSFFFSSSTTATEDVKVVNANFGGETIKIQLPYADAVANSEYMARVYTVSGGAREYMNTLVARNGLIEFHAEHFSDFVISNEYRVTLSFVPNVSGSLIGNYADKSGDLYFPKDATFALNFTVASGYKINTIEDDAGNSYAIGDTFTMPEKNVVLTITLHSREYHVYYYYYDVASGTIKTAAPTYTYVLDELNVSKLLPTIADEIKAAAPNGYNKNSAVWSDLDDALLGVSDISLFVVWTPISYNITFVDAKDNTELGKLTNVTAENYESKYVLPAIPEGSIGAWVTTWIDLPADLTDENSTEVTVVLSGNFELAKYAIVYGDSISDETPTSAAPGSTVTVKAKDHYGYTAAISVKNEAGEAIDLVDGAFTMPKAAVVIDVTYTAKSFTYKVNGKSATGTYMDTVEFTITVGKGEYLAEAPNDSVLVSTEKKNDITTLTYSFTLDGDKVITYKVDRAQSLIRRILNGKIFTDGLIPEVEGATFEKWSAPMFGALSFAVFTVVEASFSLVWLWILLAVLALILILAALYMLGLRGIVIPLLTRGAVAIVEGFFFLCMLIAKLGLKIGGRFGKSENPDDYGFTDEATEGEEAPAEEATEEAAQEATEEAPEAAEATEEEKKDEQ